jgi:hypothetical protein
MSDILIDNKNIYNFELYFLKCLSVVTKIVVVLFFVGFLTDKPKFILEINFVIKFLLGLFLIYRFNKYRKNKITFTELDRKICYSVGIYIVIISLGEYLITFTDVIREQIIKITKPIINPVKQKFEFLILS